MPTWSTVCATGHRTQHLPADARPWMRDELARIACKLRDECGTRIGISGMALGVDTWWAHAILDAGMDLWAYVPCPQQPDRWPEAAQREWRELRDRAARVRYFGQHYDVKLLHVRNDGMLLDSAAVVAGWRPTKLDGGTASAVRKSVRLGRSVVHVDPDRRYTSRPTPDRLRELLGMPRLEPTLL